MRAELEAGLSQIRLLDGMPEADLKRLATTCKWRNFASGELLLSQEDAGTDVLFIVSGRLQVQLYSASGQQVIFAEIGSGEIFGDFAAIDGMHRSATVMAMTDCVVASISAASFWSLINDHAVVRAAMLRRLVSLVRDLNDRLFQVATLKVQSRIRSHLLRLAEAAGIAGNRAVITPMPVQSDLASKLVTHREAVSREMSALTRDGILQRKGETLLICDVRRLRELVETDDG